MAKLGKKIREGDIAGFELGDLVNLNPPLRGGAAQKAVRKRKAASEDADSASSPRFSLTWYSEQSGLSKRRVQDCAQAARLCEPEDREGRTVDSVIADHQAAEREQYEPDPEPTFMPEPEPEPEPELEDEGSPEDEEPATVPAVEIDPIESLASQLDDDGWTDTNDPEIIQAVSEMAEEGVPIKKIIKWLDMEDEQELSRYQHLVREIVKHRPGALSVMLRDPVGCEVLPTVENEIRTLAKIRYELFESGDCIINDKDLSRIREQAEEIIKGVDNYVRP